VAGGPRPRPRHGHGLRLLGSGPRGLGQPRRLAARALVLTGVARRHSVLGVTHARAGTSGSHHPAPGAGAHAGVRTRAAGGMLTRVSGRHPVLGVAHALTPGPGAHAGVLTRAHAGHPHSDIVH